MDEMTRRRIERGRRLVARADGLQLQEQRQRQATGNSKEAGPNGKVIPFRTRSKEKPTDPAA